MIKILLTTILLGVTLIISSQATASRLYEGYALADGIVTEMERSEMPSSSNFCYISYDVVLNSQEFSGRNNGISDFCHLEVGDIIKIMYLISDPRKHEIASEFALNVMQDQRESRDNSLGSDSSFRWFMLVPIGIFLIFATGIIVVTIRQRKRMDVDGDGLSNDGAPATAEQKKLIKEGFRRLGIHHDVKRGLTQAQARETLREIERKLKRN
jgi:hypothetical protein